MAGLKDRYEIPGMEERRTVSKKPATIDKTSMHRLERALLPYEKKLQRQERFRRILGVKEVEGPTYQRYITGPVKRFDKNSLPTPSGDWAMTPCTGRPGEAPTPN